MKPGHKTTEFWITIIPIIGACIASLRDVLPPKYAAMLAAAASCAYAVSRGLAKLGPGDPGQATSENEESHTTASQASRQVGGMFLVMGGLALLAACSGCSSIGSLATARIHIQSGTNSVTVTQPKDTVWKKLAFDPATGRLEITGYSSAANAAAVAAQAEQTKEISSTVGAAIGQVSQVFGGLAAAYAPKAVPIPTIDPGFAIPFPSKP